MSSVDYTTRAMLVTLSISRWTATKRDKRVTNKVLAENGAANGVGRFTKQLIDKSCFEDMNKIINAARDTHATMTLPWNKEGTGVLSSALFMDYREKMSAFECQYEQAVREFINSYPQYIEAAKDKLNGLFDWTDYPTVDDLPSKFAMSVVPEPIPSNRAFLIDIPDRFKREQEELIEKKVAERMRDAHRGLYERLLETVKHMHDSLEDGVAIREATIDNIVELAELIPGLTIEDDNKIKDLAVKAKAIATRFPRKDIIGNATANKATRRDLATQVKEIEQGMASFFA